MKNKWIFTTAIGLTVLAATCCVITLAAPAAITTAPTEPTEPAAIQSSSVAVDPGEFSGLLLSHRVLEIPIDGLLGRPYPIHTDTPLNLHWTIEDTSVAEVSNLGFITPVAPGSTVVTCSDGVETASCKIIVTQACNTNYALWLPQQEINLALGDTGKVEYTYTGAGELCVFSSNPDVLQIENGCYKAVSAGIAYITCTDGLRNAHCCVKVAPPDHASEPESSPLT